MALRYLLFHKPYRVLSQFSGGEGKLTLAAFIREPGVYPAGRLDYDSEGLMLLTDDGVLQHRLVNPKFAHPRTYWAQVEGVPANDVLERLRAGVDIQGYRTRPAAVQVFDPPTGVPPRDPPIRVRRNTPDSWLELTLTEGRNRQVRHMTAAVGHPTLRLIRVAIGDLRLEGLAPGEWRDAAAAERAWLESVRTGSFFQPRQR